MIASVAGVAWVNVMAVASQQLRDGLNNFFVTFIQVLRDLDAAGRTVICVHHDLQTVADYFDHVLLLNTRVVAATNKKLAGITPIT
mgnify:CR=1 FL=1